MRNISKIIREYLGPNTQKKTYASLYGGKVLILEDIEKEEASSSALPATPQKDEAGRRSPAARSPLRRARMAEGGPARYRKHIRRTAMPNRPPVLRRDAASLYFLRHSRKTPTAI